MYILPNIRYKFKFKKLEVIIFSINFKVYNKVLRMSGNINNENDNNIIII